MIPDAISGKFDTLAETEEAVTLAGYTIEHERYVSNLIDADGNKVAVLIWDGAGWYWRKLFSKVKRSV